MNIKQLEKYAFHRDWIEQLLKVRHQVMHSGISMDMSISPNFFEERVFTPKLYGEAVESLIVTFWAETLEFTRSLIDLTKSIEP